MRHAFTPACRVRLPTGQLLRGQMLLNGIPIEVRVLTSLPDDQWYFILKDNRGYILVPPALKARAVELFKEAIGNDTTAP